MEVPGLIADPTGTSFGALLALVAAPIGARSCVEAARRVRVRVRGPRRPRRSVRPFVARSLSFLGVAVAISSGPAAARVRVPVSPHRRTSDAAPPWSEAGGFPPPRPLARTGTARTPRVLDQPGKVHPAFHRGGTDRNRTAAPLFPRARSEKEGAREERRAAMQRHPSGKGATCRHHLVREGDSLWTIAEQVLGTEDPRVIARYWPRLHRANRDVIGPDPRLLQPGQVLELPRCE